MSIHDEQQELDETARLILMDRPDISMYQFAARLRQEAGSLVSLPEIGDLWRRYRGFDDRFGPTHDVETGARRVVGGAA